MSALLLIIISNSVRTVNLLQSCDMKYTTRSETNSWFKGLMSKLYLGYSSSKHTSNDTAKLDDI